MYMRISKKRKIQKIRMYSIWFVILVAVLFVIARFAVWQRLDNVFDGITKFSMSVLSTSKDTVSGWFYGSYESEIVDLQSEVTTLRKEARKTDKLMDENEFLREQLNVMPSSQITKTSIACIIGEKPLSQSKIYIIDKGWKDGVLESQPVVSGGQLVGIITSVDEYLSEMTMITEPSIYIHAYIQGADSYGLTHGQLGSATLILEEINKDVEINVGDLVFASGQHNILWQDLVLGEISEVIIDNRTTYQSAVIKPLINLKEVKEVLILRN